MSKPLKMFLKYIGGLVLFAIGVLLIMLLIDTCERNLPPEPVYPIPREEELIEPWGFDIDE